MMKLNGEAGKNSVPIGGIVDQVLRNYGLLQRYGGWQVVNRWPEIVGERAAKMSRAIRYADGVLTIAVPSSTWRQELASQSGDILETIRSYPFGRTVKQLRFVRDEKG